VTRLSETEVFLAVVQAGGVTSAARALGLSKSAVSKQLSALEDRLGVRLLHRTTRATALTSDGDVFFTHATAAMEELAEGERAVQGSGEHLTGSLRITIPTSFGLRYVGAPLTAFLQRHPGVRIEVHVSDRKVDLVEEGYDLAVRGGSLRASSLVARRLTPMRLWMAASPGWLARQPAIELPSDLDGLPGLIYRQRDTPTVFPVYHADGREMEVRVQGRVTSDSGDLLLDAASAGLGWVIQPEFALAPYLADGRLTRILTEWEGPTSAMWVVYPHRRHLPARVRALADFLVAAFASPPWLGGEDGEAPRATQ
jgi:DNA-binding transcriptional LysR family regulator